VAIAVELRHISKRFPGVVANKDVSIKVESGSVHALIGENGAGKSTVISLATSFIFYFFLLIFPPEF